MDRHDHLNQARHRAKIISVVELITPVVKITMFVGVCAEYGFSDWKINLALIIIFPCFLVIAPSFELWMACLLYKAAKADKVASSTEVSLRYVKIWILYSCLLVVLGVIFAALCSKFLEVQLPVLLLTVLKVTFIFFVSAFYTELRWMIDTSSLPRPKISIFRVRKDIDKYPAVETSSATTESKSTVEFTTPTTSGTDHVSEPSSAKKLSERKFSTSTIATDDYSIKNSSKKSKSKGKRSKKGSMKVQKKVNPEKETQENP